MQKYTDPIIEKKLFYFVRALHLLHALCFFVIYAIFYLFICVFVYYFAPIGKFYTILRNTLYNSIQNLQVIR